jgi:hypothetical protein
MSDLREEKEELLSLAFDLLEEKYPRGLYEWLYIHDKATYDEIDHLECRVNANFQQRNSINDLKAILREYWIIHMKAIKAFQESDESKITLDRIRIERIQERETA